MGHPICGWLAGFFGEFGPAGVELVGGSLGLFHLVERRGEGGGVGGYRGLVEEVARGVEAFFGGLDFFFDGGVLAGFQVGELLLAGGSGGGSFGDGGCRGFGGAAVAVERALGTLPLLPLRVVGEGLGVALAIEAEDDG